MGTEESGRPVERRTYLSILGVAAATGASGRTAAQPETDCETSGELDSKIRDARSELAAKRERLAELEAAVADTEAETERVREETRQRRTRFQESVRERARTVGADARDAVVAVAPLGTGFRPGWFLEEGRLVTSAAPFVESDRADESGRAWFPDGETVEWELESVYDFGPDRRGFATLTTDRTPATVPVSDSADGLSPGDPLVQVGHTANVGEWVVSLGEYDRRSEDDPPHLVGDVPVARQCGGGPVLTLDGEVVGTTVEYGRLRDDRPPYLDGGVVHEHLPTLFESRHLPVETLRDRTGVSP